MASDLDENLRRFVAERANYRCEYCLLSESDSFSPHQIDHIISRKHGGLSKESNLAYSCLRCNSWKGSDLGSLDPTSQQLIRLFHPRLDLWEHHFHLSSAVIQPKTPQAEVTARLLRFNIDQRVVERRLLISLGRYP